MRIRNGYTGRMEQENTGKLGRIVAHNLKSMRESHGWSLATLAAKMATSAPTIQKLERLERKIDLNWIERIAAAFDVDPLSLFVANASGGVNVKLIPVLLKSDTWDYPEGMADYLIPIVNALAPGPNVFAIVSDLIPMEGILPSGGQAIIDPDLTDLKPDKTYLIQASNPETNETKLTVMRFHADPARLEAMSHSSSIPALKLGSDPYRVLGQVVAGIMGADKMVTTA